MIGRRDHRPKLIAFARKMRKTPTDAEKKLWSLLRRRQLHGHRFRRQVPVAGYILDFCCLSAGLAIEADGDQHAQPRARQYDAARTEVLRSVGIRILRFSDHDILKESRAVQATIDRELAAAPPPPDEPGSPLS